LKDLWILNGRVLRVVIERSQGRHKWSAEWYSSSLWRMTQTFRLTKWELGELRNDSMIQLGLM
jgi:hypothetical protein